MYFRDPVYECRTDTLSEHVIIDFAYTFGLPTTQQFGELFGVLHQRRAAKFEENQSLETV